MLPLLLRELSRNTAYVDEHLVKKKGLSYCVKVLPHPKYCKRLVGGCGKKKKKEKRKIRKERKKEKKKKEKSGIMIK